jgi:sugar phosphate isomerase/epimerase
MPFLASKPCVHLQGVICSCRRTQYRNKEGCTMIPISFMMANYVARPIGYNMAGGWGEGSRATIEHFTPKETFAGRFGAYLRDVRTMGFNAVDMWTDILSPSFATPEHVEAARRLLGEHDLAVYSYGGWFGSTREELTAACEMAVALGTSVLGGQTSMVETDRSFVVDTLKKHGLRLGLENHPEKSVEEMLRKIGDGGDGTIGTTVDTGWYGTQGVDAAEAIERLGPYVFLVHLKDVREAGAHNTCRYGEGIVPIERCVRTLQQLGYTGTISVEHEPEHFDPTEDIRESLRMLQGWLGA